MRGVWRGTSCGSCARGLSKSIRNLDRNADAYTRAHLEETRDRISKVLNAQIQSN